MAAELLGATFAATTVLSGGYASGATHLNVTSSSTGTGLSPFPATGNFRVTIFTAGVPTVVLLVTAINSGTQFATTAEVDGNASAGDLVICTITTGGMGAILAQMNQMGTFPAPSTVPFAGARWKQTDGPYEAISNGSAWQYFWNGYPVTPPPSGGWTAEGVATESGSTAGTSHYTNGFGYLIGNAFGGTSIGVNYRTGPSTPYGLTARMVLEQTGLMGQAFYGNAFAGPASLSGIVIGFRDSAGKYLVMYITSDITNSRFSFGVLKFTTDNSGASNVLGPIFSAAFAGMGSLKDLIFKIHNDGTNLLWSVSLDSVNFLTIHSETITTNLADATNVCWGAIKSSGSPLVCLYDWTQGT